MSEQRSGGNPRAVAAAGDAPLATAAGAGESTALVPLTPIHERIIMFYGDPIPVVEGPDGGVYVPLRLIADRLAVNWAGQLQRTKRHEIMGPALLPFRLQTGSGTQEMQCLPLELLSGWLFGIDASRVRSELKPRILLYQRECFAVLWRAVQAETAAAAVADPDLARSSLTTDHIRALGLALQQLADQIEAQDVRVTQAETRLENAARFMGQMQKRLARVEERVAPSAYLTADQVATLTARVKTLGLLMAAAAPGKNPYQGIWTELFREFGVSDSRHIPQAHFAAALAFLEDWGRAAGGGPSPAATAPAAPEPPTG